MLNDAYKRRHKPDVRPEAKTKQGYYKVTNKEKYIGNPDLCIYRSSWEYSFYRWCDFSPSIIRWSSEPVKIPYYDRVSKLEECKEYGRNPNDPANWVVKNYNIDVWVEVNKGDNKLEKWFVEIKPAHELKKPQPPKEGASLKEERSYVYKAKTYLINEAKWAACKAWAEKNNSKFFVFTEDTLRALIGRFWSEKPTTNNK